jgi:hypothetical protein
MNKTTELETAEGGRVASNAGLGSPHMCNTCRYDFATCKPLNIVFGIDRYPSARGADADKVLSCDAHRLMHHEA